MSKYNISSGMTSNGLTLGSGDFNGDGTDDIAWCNSETGLTGYWQINNTAMNTWQNMVTIA